MLFLSSLLAKIQLLLKILGLCDFPLSCGRPILPPQISGQPGRVLKTWYPVLPLLSSVTQRGIALHPPFCIANDTHRYVLPRQNSSPLQSGNRLQTDAILLIHMFNNTDKKWPVQAERLVSGTPRSAVCVRNIFSTIKWTLHGGVVPISVKVQTLPAPLHPHLYFFLLWHVGAAHSFVVILGSHSLWHRTPV